ncbi:hypothetical protein C0J52_05369 [Blattella germanica]|nr:hypothetical protein C0J52_05369 [Blattella germanica]
MCFDIKLFVTQFSVEPPQYFLCSGALYRICSSIVMVSLICMFAYRLVMSNKAGVALYSMCVSLMLLTRSIVFFFLLKHSFKIL